MTSFVRTAWLAFRRLPWMCCVALGSSLSRGLSDPVCKVAGRREPCGPEVPVWDSVSVDMWWFWKMSFGPAPCLPFAPGSSPSRELRGHTWTRARVHACFKAADGPATGISLRSGFTGRAAAAAGRHLEVRGGMPLFVFEFSWSFPPSTASSWPLCGPPRPPAAVGTGKICRLCLLEDRWLSKAPSLGTGGRNAAQPTEADALAGPSGAFQAQPILRGEEERIPPDC